MTSKARVSSRIFIIPRRAIIETCCTQPLQIITAITGKAIRGSDTCTCFASCIASLTDLRRIRKVTCITCCLTNIILLKVSWIAASDALIIVRASASSTRWMAEFTSVIWIVRILPIGTCWVANTCILQIIATKATLTISIGRSWTTRTVRMTFFASF